ncbi:hypothetical protein V1477_017237, partial [Vespula maculifrons]
NFVAVARVAMKVSASLKRISINFDVDLPHFQPTTNHPPSISIYIAIHCFGAIAELLKLKLYNGDNFHRESTIMSVVLWTSVREHRNIHGCHPCNLKCEVGIHSQPLTTTKSILVQLCFGLQRGKIQIFTDAIRASINEQLIQIYNSLFDFSLKYEVGIHSHPQRQQSLAFDRLLQILVQLCFGLRRGKIQIFTDAIRASINEQLIQIYNSLFDFSLKCEVGIDSYP